jgi:hypothetical protein
MAIQSQRLEQPRHIRQDSKHVAVMDCIQAPGESHTHGRVRNKTSSLHIMGIVLVVDLVLFVALAKQGQYQLLYSNDDHVGESLTGMDHGFDDFILSGSQLITICLYTRRDIQISLRDMKRWVGLLA